MKKQFTKPQLMALVALNHLCASSRSVSGYKRWQIGCKARMNGQGYPLKTLWALWRAGLVAPIHEVAVELVDSGVCRCGCDRWIISEAGKEFVKTLKVVEGKPDRPPDLWREGKGWEENRDYDDGDEWKKGTAS